MGRAGARTESHSAYHGSRGAEVRNLLIAGGAVVVLLIVWRVLWKSTPADRLAALQQEVQAKGGIVFQTQLHGQPAAFLVLNCEVHLLDASQRKVRRKRVLKTGFYLMPLVCTGQSIREEDGYVIAVLENRAIGAGGGNTSGGTYRTRDGVAWEKQTRKGWLPVDEAQN